MSLNRYIKGDWGDICKEDALLNDEAVKSGERIFATYIFDKKEVEEYQTFGGSEYWEFRKTEEKDPDVMKIWIITEWDRSVTTILFPSEY